MKNILVTGGAGYIGSHTVVQLLEKGYNVIVVDNLSNSNEKVFDRINQITHKGVTFYKLNCCDYECFKKVFNENKIDAAIHFAGLKAVGESVQKPLMYYQNNLISTMNLIELMDEFNVNNLVFSSSATVYGDPARVPIDETFDLHVTNPYGRTKLMIEDMLRDFCKVHPAFNVALLRYFNPIGAHESGLIGEDPNGIPNNLVPFIAILRAGRVERVRRVGENRTYPVFSGVGEKRLYVLLVDGLRRPAARIAREELEHVRADRGGGLPHREIAAGARKVASDLERHRCTTPGRSRKACGRDRSSCSRDLGRSCRSWRR